MRKRKVSIFVGTIMLLVLSTIVISKAMAKARDWLTDRNNQKLTERQEELREHQIC